MSFRTSSQVLARKDLAQDLIGQMMRRKESGQLGLNDLNENTPSRQKPATVNLVPNDPEVIELRKSLFTVIEGHQDSAISRAASSPENNSDPCSPFSVEALSPNTPVDIYSDKFSHLVQNQQSDVSDLSRYKSTVENVNIKQ